MRNIIHYPRHPDLPYQRPDSLCVQISSTPPTPCRARWTTRCCTPPHVQGGRHPDAGRGGFQGGGAAARHRVGDRENLGIDVEECPVQSRPPRQLKDAFASVLEGRGERGRKCSKTPTATKSSHQQSGRRRPVAHQPGRIRPRAAGERHPGARPSGSRTFCPNSALIPPVCPAAPDRNPGPRVDQCAGQDLSHRRHGRGGWKPEGTAATVKS